MNNTTLANKYGIKNDPNANVMALDANGEVVIEGGQNLYGMDKADTILMRDMDGNLQDRFKETMGDSVTKLKDYGSSMGEDTDERMLTSMGDAYTKLKDTAMTDGDTEWAKAQRVQQLSGIDKANNSQMQNALAMSAMKGGVGSGSAERMLANAGNSAMMQRQSANANISAQDMQQKNQLLSQIGGVEQGIDQFNANAFTNDTNRKLNALQTAGQVEQAINSSNVGALRGDLDRQNMASHENYAQDVQAWGAKQTADGQKASANSCFLEGTKIEMEDGSEMNIEDVEIGDVTALGGIVTMTMVAFSDHYYNLNGVFVTGSHAVFDNGSWKRVEDVEQAQLIEETCKVYCLGNQEHRLVINGVKFGDYYEDDDFDFLSPEQLLQRMNNVE